APLRGDELELRAQGGVGFGGGDHAEAVAGLLQPRDRLAHLADGAALERELAGTEDRLVADLDRLQPEPLVSLEVGGAEEREPPAVRVDDAAELGQQLVEFFLLADQVAADERAAADDAVGEECASARREEPALVPAQREERERVPTISLEDRESGA